MLLRCGLAASQGGHGYGLLVAFLVIALAIMLLVYELRRSVR